MSVFGEKGDIVMFYRITARDKFGNVVLSDAYKQYSPEELTSFLLSRLAMFEDNEDVSTNVSDSEGASMIAEERVRQRILIGDSLDFSTQEWVGIIGEEFGELCQAVNETFLGSKRHPGKGGYDNIIREAVQVGAATVELIEHAISEKNKEIEV